MATLIPKENEVWVTQYLRPDGRTQRVLATVTPEAKKISDNMNMLLSAEVLTTGQVAVYARFSDEPEENEGISIANNGPGDNSPEAVLSALILQKATERKCPVCHSSGDGHAMNEECSNCQACGEA